MKTAWLCVYCETEKLTECVNATERVLKRKNVIENCFDWIVNNNNNTYLYSAFLWSNSNRCVTRIYEITNCKKVWIHFKIQKNTYCWYDCFLLNSFHEVIQLASGKLYYCMKRVKISVKDNLTILRQVLLGLKWDWLEQ